MKHILFVNQFAVTPDHSSGTRHFLMARELVARGCRATVVASDINLHTGRRMRVGDTAELHESTIEGVRFITLPGRADDRSKAARLIAMLDFARRISTSTVQETIGRVDIVYGSSPHLFAAAAAGRIARRLKREFVLEIRDVWPKSLVDLGGVSRYHPLVSVMAYLERRLYRQADHIVTLLPASVDHICDHGGSRDRISVIPNFVDPGLHTGVPAQADPTRFTAMYAGAHGVANALDTVLDAAALCAKDPELKVVRFRLIGDGPEKARLSARVAAEGLINVSMEDAVPKKQIGAVMAEADAFIMPLKASAVFKHGISPNKLFDYMAAARPTLFSVDTPVNLIDATASGVTVAPENPAALAEGLRTLVRTSMEERAAMGARARAYALEKHSPAAAAEAVLAIIESLSRTRSGATAQQSEPGALAD